MVRFFLLSSLFVYSITLEAKVFKCTSKSGKISFQQEQCSSGKEKVIMQQAENKFGLHSSWFEKPAYILEEARCTETGCICGDNNYKYQQNINTRLINALASLKASWKNYTQTLDMQQKRNSTGRFPAIKKSLSAKACNISIHQKTIELYYEQVSTVIIAEHQVASKALKSIDKECEKPKESGWTSSKKAKDWVDCYSKNRSGHNKANRIKKRSSSQYFSLMQEVKQLEQPRY